MKSTKMIYDVTPDHFDNMTYFEALEEKIKLSNKVKKRIHNETSTMTYGCEEYNKLFGIYQTANEAIRYNQWLLDERKKHDENKKTHPITLHYQRNGDYS